MHKIIASIVKKHIDKDIPLERPKEKSFGHFALPLFVVAKERKMAPQIIANELAQKLRSEEMFESVEVMGGYVNMRLSESFLDSLSSSALKNCDSFGAGENGEKILLEFVSANPTGPLHIGHARGAIFGSALLNIGRHLGHKITSEYYINDAGNQIHLLGLSIYLAGRELLGLPVIHPESYYRGEYINDIAELALQKFGKESFEDDKSIPTFSDFGKDLMLDEIKSNLKGANIEFDNFVSERALFDRWEATRKKLETNGALAIVDDKVWLKSSEHGDEKDRVIVRESGEPTYLAGDIIYHNDKFERGFDRYINIWGADHHSYIARVKSAVKYLGYDESRLEVLLSQMVSLLKGGEPYKMSKRAGNFILMRDVVEDIGQDALRLVFLSKKSDTHLEFDVDELKKHDASNPVFYINYAHARVSSLFEKAGKAQNGVIETPLNGLNESAKDLLFNALLLPLVLEDSFAKRDPQRVVEYLKNLASDFHSFYNANKIVGEPNEDKYLKVASLVALSIRTALGLLGIRALERM